MRVNTVRERVQLELLKQDAINGDGDFKDQYIYDGFNEFMRLFTRREYEN